MRSFRTNLWLSLALCIFCVFSNISEARAGVLNQVATRLTISPLEPVVVGKTFTITASLTDADGKRIGAVSNEVLYLFVDGVLKRRIRTNRVGTAAFIIRKYVPVGSHSIEIVYKGSSGLKPSTASAELRIVPAEIKIHVVPPLSNVSFSLAGLIFTSDQDGIARIKVNEPGIYTLRLLHPQIHNSDMEADFIRWGDDRFSAYRSVTVPAKEPLHVGFEMSYQVSLTFVDRLGQPVDPARITSLTLKGSNGTTYVFEDPPPYWLPAGRVARLSNGLEQTKVSYSLMSVIIDGSNVVNQAQQRFDVHPNDVWTIKLLLYDASFTGRDALFHFPIGTGIHLEYPDGSSREFPFGPDRDLNIESLARGIYKATIIGVNGMAPTMPLAMSRDQTVELLVVSTLDITFVVVLGASIALGLLFFGRPELFKMLVAVPGVLFPKRRTKRLQRVFTMETASLPALRQCPFCQATIKQAKAGLNRSGSQRYRCSACRRVYTPRPNPIGFSSEIQERALQLYLEGNSRRSIARNLKVSPQTISKWIVNHRIERTQVPVCEAREVVELDDPSALLLEQVSPKDNSHYNMPEKDQVLT